MANTKQASGAVKTRRPYRSRLRQEQAADTRQRLITAARNAFAEHGYKSASLEQIAMQAGVSVQTVYASVGNKRQLLRAVLEEVGERVDLRRNIEEILATADPRQQLRLVAGLARRQWHEGHDFLRIVLRGRRSDAELEGLFGELQAGRRRGMSVLARQLDERGLLRDGVQLAQAVDLLPTLSGPELYEIFVSDLGWSLESYEAWVGQALIDSLLERA